MRSSSRAPVALIVVFAFSSCVTVAAPDARAAPPTANASHRVDTPSMEATDLLMMVRRVASTGGDRAVDRAVALFPDLALAVANSTSASADVLAIAASYDRVHGGASPLARRRLAGVLAGATDESSRIEAAEELASLGARHAALVILAATVLSADGWRRAAVIAQGVPDPKAWEELLASRPPGAPVGDEAEQRLSIATWRLVRGELNAAALAAVRGEALVSGAARAPFRLLRVRALLLSGRQGEALTLLQDVGATTAPERAEALALEGLALAERGELPAGIEAMRGALAAASAFRGRERVAADLAVAMLRSGDTSHGLMMLATAQRDCESAGDLDGLVRALRNEAVCRRVLGEEAVARAVDARAVDLVATHGLLTDVWGTR